jgi:hypothetical protein
VSDVLCCLTSCAHGTREMVCVRACLGSDAGCFAALFVHRRPGPVGALPPWDAAAACHALPCPALPCPAGLAGGGGGARPARPGRAVGVGGGGGGTREMGSLNVALVSVWAAHGPRRRVAKLSFFVKIHSRQREGPFCCSEPSSVDLKKKRKNLLQ